jgi:YD repeat-containing protein
MKQILLFCLLLGLVFSSTNIFSQTINYTYDNAGNRTGRDTIQIGGRAPLKSATMQKVIKDETFAKHSIKIYPNPTHGLIEIELPEDPDNNSRILLIVSDIRGRVIINKPHDANRITLDLSSQPNGLYILNIKKGNLISQWKIIKQ